MEMREKIVQVLQKNPHGLTLNDIVKEIATYWYGDTAGNHDNFDPLIVQALNSLRIDGIVFHEEDTKKWRLPQDNFAAMSDEQLYALRAKLEKENTTRQQRAREKAEKEREQKRKDLPKSKECKKIQERAKALNKRFADIKSNALKFKLVLDMEVGVTSSFQNLHLDRTVGKINLFNPRIKGKLPKGMSSMVQGNVNSFLKNLCLDGLMLAPKVKAEVDKLYVDYCKLVSDLNVVAGNNKLSLSELNTALGLK